MHLGVQFRLRVAISYLNHTHQQFSTGRTEATINIKIACMSKVQNVEGLLVYFCLKDYIVYFSNILIKFGVFIFV